MPGRRDILVLGGGAVVRHCFAPALVGLGLDSATTVVEPRAVQPDLPGGLRVLSNDFRHVLASDLSRFSHCVVALPNSLHYEAVTRALAAGLDVLCEKPLALRSEECSRLAELADARQRVLVVNMVRRLYPSIRIAHHALSSGWLGELKSIRISHGGFYGWPVASLAPFDPANGGVLADMGIHYLDLVEMLGGSLRPVAYQDDYAGGVESECEYSLSGPAGLKVTISLSRLRGLKNEIEIAGSLGTIRLGVDSFDECTFETAAGESMRLAGPGGRVSRFEDHFGKQMELFLQASFVPMATSAVPGPGLADARSAARAAALLEWAYANRKPGSQESGLAPAAERLGEGAIYVTGAAGFIGSHLVDRLSRDATGAITAAYHSLRSCAGISRYPVRFHHTDLLDPASAAAAVKGSRYVFHVAVGKDPATERAVNVQGTKNIVEAAIEAGAEAVVVLSSMWVLGYPDGVADETAPYKPYGGSYATTKAEMERWCLERARTSGKTRIVVLLPSCVYGPRGLTYTETPVSLAREGRFCWIAGGNGIANVNFVGNLVDAMILAAIRPEAHGRRFIINDETLTWREFLTPFLEPWLDSIPEPDARAFAELCAQPPGPGAMDVLKAAARSRELNETLRATSLVNQLRPVLKNHAPWLVARLRSSPVSQNAPPAAPRKIPPDWLAEVFAGTATRFSSASARSVLGWTPRFSREEAAAITLRWLSEQGFYSSPRD